ncbi:hypothetical protein GCM10009123_16380 [Kangiella japonica]|uniref:LysM domain-containing protein n=1 Tax=Kangiella japonica TaxID=647384 RepID=A0ABN0T206_9GAMM
MMFSRGFWSSAIVLVTLLVPQCFAEDWLYTVRKGDTIWGLSHKYLKDPLKFQDIQKYNNVKLDRQLPPGVTLKFPMEYLKFAPAEVNVNSINGEAYFVRRGVRTPLTEEQKLVLDDILVTKKDSSVALLFADGSELLLGENSELIFDVQTKWGETGMVDSRVRLMQGSAEGRVEKLRGPGANFEVQTPSAVATVRGTEFRVRLDKENEGIVFNEVNEGTVSVQLHENKESVKEGYGLITSAKLPLTKPKELLPEPKWVNPRSKYPGHPVTVTWQPIDEAISYQVELFKDKELTVLEYKATVNTHQFTLPEVEVGEYSLRLRAIDKDGLQGLNATHHFTISPVPTSPQLNTFIEEYTAGESLEFSWKAADGATQYRWQLAKDRQFRNIVSQTDLKSRVRHIQEGLPAGTYYWRVTAGNYHGFGQYSEPKRFDVKRPIPPQLVLSAETITTEDALTLSWKPVPLAKEYYWQVSTDEQFRDIIKEGKSQSNHLVLEGFPEAQLYIRVATLGPYNRSRFSETQRVLIEPQGNGKTAFGIGSVLLFILLL